MNKICISIFVILFSSLSYANKSNDVVIAKKISDMLSSRTTLISDFTQIDSFGTSFGKIYIDYKKRLVAIDYEKGNLNSKIILKDNFLHYYDRNINEYTVVRPNSSIGSIVLSTDLLSANISIINAVEHENDLMISFVIKDNPDEGIIALNFKKEPFYLSEIIVKDFENDKNLSRIILSNPKLEVKIPNKTFIVKSISG